MKNERQIHWRNLVHDITDDSDKTDGIETGCGIVLQAKPELLTDDATTCLVCISDNVNYERTLNSLRVLRDSGDLMKAFIEALKKGGTFW